MNSYSPSRRSFERIPSLARPLSLRPLGSSNSYAPSSSAVMKAIADANEASCKEKVNQQREVAKKLENLEHAAKINEKINEHIRTQE